MKHSREEHPQKHVSNSPEMNARNSLPIKESNSPWLQNATKKQTSKETEAPAYSEQHHPSTIQTQSLFSIAVIWQSLNIIFRQ